jgi:NAD(P)-dependent dehydrogenase (short-subunit alcohol dehydrogenase family)
MGLLDGRVAVVTGAARGIGAAYARRYAEEGARVCVADVLDCAPAVDAINRGGGEAIGVRCDVADGRQVEAMAAATLEAYGKIDILLANAANVAVFKPCPITEVSAAEWDRVMAVNVRGVFLCARAVVPGMRKRKYGKLVLVSSTTIHKGVPHTLAYVTSKGAVAAMTRALARELGDDGVRVNAIAPGLTMSDVFAADQSGVMDAKFAFSRSARALKRDETPSDLVGAAVFLASAESDFVTGQMIVVDGGEVMH